MRQFFISIFKASKSVLNSKFKWIAILFFILLYRIEFMQDTGFGFAKILQIIMTFGILILTLKKAPNIIKFTITRTNAPIITLLVLYLYALLSSIWSFLPAFSLFLSFQNLVIIFLCAYIFSIPKNFYSLEKLFLYLCTFICLFEILCNRIIEGGLFNHFLTAGSLSAIILTYSFAEYIRSKNFSSERERTLKYSILISFIVLILSTSAGANAAAVFGIGIAFLLSKRFLYFAFIITCGIVLFFNEQYYEELLLFIMPGKTMEVIESGTGRDYIWDNLIEIAKQKPLLGWGFACIERVNPFIIKNQILSDAHSNFIGIYGSLGIIGLIIYFAHVLSCLRFSLIKHKNKGMLGLLCAFCCATLNGYSYGFLSGKTVTTTIAYIMIVILFFYYNKRSNA